MTQPSLEPWQYWLGVGFAGFLTLGGTAMIIFGINFLRAASSANSWPIAPGEINAVSIRRETTRNGGTKVVTHYLTITYAYEVESVSYTGDRYSFGDGTTASKRFHELDQAIAEKNKYPMGDTIDVYYNPADPSDSLLKPGWNFGTWMPLTLGLLFTPCGVLLFLGVFRHPNS